MKNTHDKGRRSKRVSEPVQVYLGPQDQDRLERLTNELEATKSDVLRKGLEALERQLLDPEHHPALQIIGIAADDADGETPYDIAREHDRYLADLEDRRVTRKGRRGC